MLTFIGFILTLLGSINWLLIGLLQYDFIAGLFGFQASLFSRLVYILFGIGAIILVIRIIANKGSVKVWEKRRKKTSPPQIQPANVEASQETFPRQHTPIQQPQQEVVKTSEPQYIYKEPYQQKFDDKNFYHDNIFDEHFKK